MVASNTYRLGGLHIDSRLYDFVENEVLKPPSGCEALQIDSSRFWTGFENAVRTLGPQCAALLQRRESLQAQIDHWHLTNGPGIPDPVAYKAFLTKIGYLVDEGPDFRISVDDVDPEIAEIAGPQLVVPLTNQRFSINAANARWGSLFDAFYVSDLIAETKALQGASSEVTALQGKPYDPKRGEEVIRLAIEFLDKTFPLEAGSYTNIQKFRLLDGCEALEFQLGDSGQFTRLLNDAVFVGYSGEIDSGGEQGDRRCSILFRHHQLHVELVFDRSDPQAKSQHPAGLKDVVMESALTTIQDCEDSVAVVDPEDKVALYRNWLGLMTGTLAVKMPDGTRRVLNPDKIFINRKGEKFSVPGRSLMLIRNVGHHMFTDAITSAQTGEPVPEGFLDAFVTSLIALYDVQCKSKLTNSRSGSIYIVKPKQHGPEEVLLTNLLMESVEQTLGLPRHTIKLGIMDEEKRTSVNLKACLREARRRTIFINTGFLDRTADEIRTGFEAGPFDLKENLKSGVWSKAYEENNVWVGLMCGLFGKGQIGKGMWAQPDHMKKMVLEKMKQLRAGATTAWVPSPRAAVLHAMHYHEVDVREVQRELLAKIEKAMGERKEDIRKRQILTEADRMESAKEDGLIEGGSNPFLNDLLTVQVLSESARLELPPRQIQAELDNNIQSILGYVVRWVEQGIGASKVPNLAGIPLMEDRATLRISSQHVSNWLRHGVVTEEQVFDSLRHMAMVVDEQNKKDAFYSPMASRPITSVGFQAAVDLVFKGARQPNGYTEFILHQKRRQVKTGKEPDQELGYQATRWSKL